jgi:hypothetical protein
MIHHHQKASETDTTLVLDFWDAVLSCRVFFRRKSWKYVMGCACSESTLTLSCFVLGWLLPVSIGHCNAWVDDQCITVAAFPMILVYDEVHQSR